MSEPIQIMFTFKEVVTELVKKQGIKEGIWGPCIRFGIQGANLGPNDSAMLPTALVPVLDIGIQKFDKPNNLTVDASEITSPHEILVKSLKKLSRPPSVRFQKKIK